jgi:hypothetical protein
MASATRRGERELDDPDGVRKKFSEPHDLAFEDHDVLIAIANMNRNAGGRR